MEEKIAAILELERRGALPPEKIAALNELRRRGAFPQSEVSINRPSIDSNDVPLPPLEERSFDRNELKNLPEQNFVRDMASGMAFPGSMSAVKGSLLSPAGRAIQIGAEDLISKGLGAIGSGMSTIGSKLRGRQRIADLAGGKDVAKAFASPETQKIRQQFQQQGVQANVAEMLPKTSEQTPTIEMLKAQESMGKLMGMPKTAKKAELARSDTLKQAFDNLNSLIDEVGGKSTQEAGQAFNDLRAKHGQWTNPDKVAAVNDAIQENIAKKTAPLFKDLHELTASFDEIVAAGAPEDAKRILKNLSFKKQAEIETIINEESKRLIPDIPVVQSNNTRTFIVDMLKNLRNQQTLSRDEIAQIKFLANKLSDFRKVPNAGVADWLHTMQSIGKDSFGGKIPFSVYSELREAMIKDASESSRYYRARGFSVGDIGKETDMAIGGYRDSFKRSTMEDLISSSAVKDASGNPIMGTLDAKSFRNTWIKNKDDYSRMFSPEIVSKIDSSAEVAERIQKLPKMVAETKERYGELGTRAGMLRTGSDLIAKAWDSLNAEMRLKIMTTKEGQDILEQIGKALREKDVPKIQYGAAKISQWAEGYIGGEIIKSGLLDSLGRSLPQQQNQPQSIMEKAYQAVSPFGRPGIRIY